MRSMSSLRICHETMGTATIADTAEKTTSAVSFRRTVPRSIATTDCLVLLERVERVLVRLRLCVGAPRLEGVLHVCETALGQLREVLHQQALERGLVDHVQPFLGVVIGVELLGVERVGLQAA